MIIMYVVQRRRIIIIIYIRRHLAHQPGDPVSATLCLPFAFPPAHTKTVFSSFLLRSGGRLRKLLYTLALTRYAVHHNARICAPKRSQAFRIHVASTRDKPATVSQLTGASSLNSVVHSHGLYILPLGAYINHTQPMSLYARPPGC